MDFFHQFLFEDVPLGNLSNKIIQICFRILLEKWPSQGTQFEPLMFPILLIQFAAILAQCQISNLSRANCNPTLQCSVGTLHDCSVTLHYTTLHFTILHVSTVDDT